MPSTSAGSGFTIWFTGMSCSGKSTLASYLASRLRSVGRKVEVLDGPEVNDNLSKNLGVSKEDRDTHVRRLGFVAKLLSRNDVVTISASVSPYREARDQNRREIGRFIEVFADCPVEKLIERDTQGLYKKALSGELPHFTGISDPYEPPTNAEVVVRTDLESVDESAAKIFDSLVDLGFIGSDELRSISGKKRSGPSAARRPAQGSKQAARRPQRVAAKKAVKRRAGR